MQPISRTLCTALLTHAANRGATSPTDALLRYANHTPLTSRRYDHLWTRVRAALPWAAKLGVSTHWLRHTTLTRVERNYSYGIARAYASHTDTKGGSTLTYIKGVPREVATALSALTGEPHPLALADSSGSGPQVSRSREASRSISSMVARYHQNTQSMKASS